MRSIPATAAILFLLVSTTACDTAGGTATDAVQSTALEETGTATLDGDDIVVQLASGPVRLTPADDTTFFVCDGEDDCETVDEATFRAEVTDGDDIRVLGPNAELLTPDAEELPAQVWVVLDRPAD